MLLIREKLPMPHRAATMNLSLARLGLIVGLNEVDGFDFIAKSRQDHVLPGHTYGGTHAKNSRKSAVSDRKWAYLHRK